MDGPLARAGEALQASVTEGGTEGATLLGAGVQFNQEGAAADFVRKLKAIGGSSVLLHVEERRGGKTLTKLSPCEVDAWRYYVP